MAYKPQKPDLDLINMVQQARMMHDSQAQPSQVSAVYWIEAKRKSGDYPAPTPRMGEWRIPVMVVEVDALWEKIKTATEVGKLGHKSKVSTKPAKGQADINARVICVRTVDADDLADVERVRAALVDLGITTDMTYQRDHTPKSDET